MSDSIEWPSVRRILHEARTENLRNWAFEYGSHRFPEAAAELAGEALLEAERNPEIAGFLFSLLSAADLWHRTPEAASRLHALIGGLKGQSFEAALAALIQCAEERARELILRHLEDEDQDRADSALEALGDLADGPAQVALHLNEFNNLELEPSRLLYLLLKKDSWTHGSVRAALEVLSSVEPDSEELHLCFWTILHSFQGAYYAVLIKDPKSKEWPDALVKNCCPLLSEDDAHSVAKLLAKGKRPFAAEKLVDLIPASWLERPSGCGESKLARTILQICSADKSWLNRCAKAHPQMLVALISAAIARVQEEANSPTADPNSAGLQETLEVLGSAFANLREESAWSARCAFFGAEAIEPLNRMLQGKHPYSAMRAARVLASIGSPEALRFLVLEMEKRQGKEESLRKSIKAAGEEVLARVDLELLNQALVRKEWQVAAHILERWCTPGPLGEGLAKAAVACADTLFFEDESFGSFCEFVRAHPLAGFIEPLANAWRPGERALGEALEILFALHRPQDERQGAIQSDLVLLERQSRDKKNILDSPEILLRLRCRACRAIYLYRIREALVSSPYLKREPRPPLSECAIITDALKCKRCGSIDDYEWTKQAEHALMFHSMGNLWADPTEEERERPGPSRSAIRWFNVRSVVGEDLTFSETLERLQKRIAEQPADPEWRLRLGNLYLTMRRLDLALAAYASVLERWPEHVDAAFQRGLVLERLEKYGEALAAYTQAALALKAGEPDFGTKAEELGRKLRDLARKAETEAPWEALDAIGRLLESSAYQRRPPPNELAFPNRKADHGLLAGKPLYDAYGEDAEEDDYAAGAPEPVAPIRTEGRQPRPNDRCACGSGKKYKKCCGRISAGGKLLSGSAPAPAPVRAAAPGNEDARKVANDLNAAMLQASSRLQNKEEFQQAVRRWMGQPAEERPVLVGDETASSLFAEFLLHDWRPEGGDRRTLLERFAEAESARFSTPERRQVEAWLHRRRKGWYEVEAADGAGTTEVKDCMTGETFRIFDLALSRVSKRGAMYVFALFPCGERLEMSGFASGVPRNLRRAFKAYLEREYARWRQALQDPEADSAWPRFFSAQAAEITREIARLGTLPPQVVLSTGEAHAYGYKIYGFDDRRSVLRGLEAQTALRYQGWGKGNEVEGESYGWIHLKAAGPLPFQKPLTGEDDSGQPVLVLSSKQVALDAKPEAFDPLQATEEDLAGIFMGRDRLEVLAFSKERLDFVCQALEARLAGQLREQRCQQLDREYVNDLWQNRGARKPSRKPPPLPSEHANLQEAFLNEHWSKWPDHPLPALHGQTPRAAARDPRQRGELEALLLDMEESDSHARESAPSNRKHLERLRRELNMR